MYKMLKSVPIDQYYRSRLMRCGLCGGTTTSFKVLCNEPERAPGRSYFDGSDLRKMECGAAFVFLRTRYAALVATEALQSPNPMSWVTDLAPEPHDIYWSNLNVPYRLLWIRRIAVFVASILFVIFFLVPVVFTQSLVHLEKLEKTFPFMKGIVKRKFMKQLITGYLPSDKFMIFLYIVPPLMIFFSTLEGSISRSGRKRSATNKILYFVIWNVFFVNIRTGTAIDHYQDSIFNLGHPKDIPNQLAKAILLTEVTRKLVLRTDQLSPSQSSATFFMTYVLTSGWASLSVELIQPFGLLCNFFYKFILRNKDDSTYRTYTFPYHTEVPRVLLFGVLGFTCSILAPLLLSFLLVYLFLAYLVYRNQAKVSPIFNKMLARTW
ncbi:CSC1-like protein RXW8 [Abeliophyllum distichum]|uniref:CSC1-like protein RXW8 n=1 Tax=Abeliophyllum distichum TaxID=126358 RepID=A0ABD1SYS0_9LAMI